MLRTRIQRAGKPDGAGRGLPAARASRCRERAGIDGSNRAAGNFLSEALPRLVPAQEPAYFGSSAAAGRGGVAKPRYGNTDRARCNFLGTRAGTAIGPEAAVQRAMEGRRALAAPDAGPVARQGNDGPFFRPVVAARHRGRGAWCEKSGKKNRKNSARAFSPAASRDHRPRSFSSQKPVQQHTAHQRSAGRDPARGFVKQDVGAAGQGQGSLLPERNFRRLFLPGGQVSGRPFKQGLEPSL